MKGKLIKKLKGHQPTLVPMERTSLNYLMSSCKAGMIGTPAGVHSCPDVSRLDPSPLFTGW